VKPGDRYAVPLCGACHAKQHRIGELTFWSALRIDPLNGAVAKWVGI
jgi:sterol desaturase/sphingolipid hydroxylase (fatty acid hydroxylase superfamily)